MGDSYSKGRKPLSEKLLSNLRGIVGPKRTEGGGGVRAGRNVFLKKG